MNAPPDFPASFTAAGPTLAPGELAGHKLLALFDRAAARDFADVYVLVSRFGKDMLLARAAQIDVIDLGMGNPDGATPRVIVNKLVEASRNARNHRYSQSRGIRDRLSGTPV